MSDKLSSLHGVIHMVMLVIIIALVSKYRQVGIDCPSVCERSSGQKRAREFVDKESTEKLPNLAQERQDEIRAFATRLSPSSTLPSLSLASEERIETYHIPSSEEEVEEGEQMFIVSSSFASSMAVFKTTRDFLATSYNDIVTDRHYEKITLEASFTDRNEDTNTVSSLTIEMTKTVPKFDDEVDKPQEEDIDVFDSVCNSNNLRCSTFLPSDIHDSVSVNKKQFTVVNDNYVNRNIPAYDDRPTTTVSSKVIFTDENMQTSTTDISVNVATSISSSLMKTMNSETVVNKLDERVVEKANFGFTNPESVHSSRKTKELSDETDRRICELIECEGENTFSVDGMTTFEQNHFLHEFTVIETQINGNEDQEHESNLSSASYVNLLMNVLDSTNSERLAEQGTSVWCSNSGHSGKSCYFQNVCYNIVEKDFIFLRSKNSVVETDTPEAMNELFSINLSTVPNHNAHMFRIVTIPGESLQRFSVSLVEKPGLLMSRFKPDNIMHVVHDDVLPLFHTMRTLRFPHTGSRFDAVVVFADDHDDGDFISLYLALTSVPPILLNKLDIRHSVDVLCFKELNVGLSTQTLWYQYGFFKLQGPLQVDRTEVATNVKRAAHYFSNILYQKCMLCGNRNYLVLLSRKDNRLILNEGQLILAIARSTKLKVMSVSLETHSFEEIVSIVRTSRGILGMHGSLLSVAIFLQPGSFVIELFPYGVNPSKYTPFKTLCDFPDLGLIYKSWTNPSKEKSTPHPYWPADMGGIQHLPDETQWDIVSQTEVPEHMCCEDPSWLYHIYQDTEVDVPAVSTIALEALAETNLVSDGMSREREDQLDTSNELLPGPVKNLKCEIGDQKMSDKAKFVISWSVPWNVELVAHELLEFNLISQNVQTNDSHSVDFPAHINAYFLSSEELFPMTAYNVWVRVALDKTRLGPYSFVACKT